MKYIVDISHYYAGQGYSHTETFETGHTDKVFPASDWNIYDDPIVEHDDRWVEIKVSFYEDDADPTFDDPIYVDTHRI